MTAVLVALRDIGYHSMPLDIQYMYHISLMTLFQGLSNDIKHVKITRTKTKLTKNVCENLKFVIYFFEQGYLPEYFINLLEIFNTCRWRAFGGKRVSEFSFRS